MTTQALGKLLDSYLQDFEGQPGFWRGSRHDVPVFVFSDDDNDRLILMSPIGIVEQIEADLLHVLLQANYDRALDARYAMRGNELWSVVVHPLATLATDDLPNFFDQLVTLVKNTGSTFASTELVFHAPHTGLVLEPDESGDGEDDGDAEDGEAALGDDEEDDEDEGEARGR